jgi:hypothetical protein
MTYPFVDTLWTTRLRNTVLTGDRWKRALTVSALARSVDSSPEGPSDANGGDDIKVHASSRFLRAADSPPALTASLMQSCGRARQPDNRSP